LASYEGTYWQAQLADGTKMQGGSGFVGDVNVGAVPIDRMRVFTVAHNTYSHTYYAPTKTWYKDGKPWVTPAYEYPTTYTLKDGTSLTVGFDAVTKLLDLSQTQL
jgi:hypothetical protein